MADSNNKAIFFDSGGTLFNPRAEESDRIPSPAHVKSERGRRSHAMLTALGHDIPYDEYQQSLEECTAGLESHGSRAAYLEIVKACFEKLGIPPLEEEVSVVTEAYCGPRYAAWLYTDVVATLQKLDAMGFVMGVITNNRWPFWVLDRMYHAVGIYRFLPHRVYSSQCGHEKPDPKIFDHAKCLLDGSVEDCYFMGDSETADIAGAHEAGWKSILFDPEQGAGTSRADKVLHHWRELPDLLNSW